MNIILPFSMSFLDYFDNFSHATVVYIMGCNNNCLKCQNKDFQNPTYSSSIKVNINEFKEYLQHFCNKYRTNKVVLLGGDPLFSKNIEEVKEILLDTRYNFVVYTGYDIEYVVKNNIKNFEFIKCGKYEEKYKQDSIKNDDFMILGSKNQKVYNKKYELISCDGMIKFNKETGNV